MHLVPDIETDLDRTCQISAGALLDDIQAMLHGQPEGAPIR